MANYLQADYIPEDKLFVPNYNLINMALQTRQSQYDQGFAQVKGIYNSILSSKATNDGNAEQQQNYLKSFEDKLKNLPSMDLSVAKNVDAAKSVFDPFYDDKELMRDISLTKIAGDQLSKGQAMLNSSDPKQRAMHSPISDEYVNITLDELKRAKRGDGSIMNVTPRYYVPAVNLTEKFKDYLTSKNFGLVSETRDGKGAIFSTSGGKLIEAPLRSLFDGLITGDERKYFDAWGDVLYNRQIKQQMSQGLGLKDAKTAIAVDLANQTKTYYENDLNSNQQAYDRALAQWESYKAQHTIDGKVLETEDAYRLKGNVMFYQDQVTNLKSKVGQFDLNKTANEYLTQGSGYWSNRLYDDSLTKIVRGYAGLTATSTVKTDDIFWKQNEVLQKELDRKNARDIAQMRIDAAGKAVASSGGAATLTIGPDGELTVGTTVTTGTSTKGTLGKKTKEEQDLEEANTKNYLGMQNIPAPTNKSYIDILYDTRNKTEKLVGSAKLSFLEKGLRNDFPDANKFIDQVLKEQEQYGQPKSASSLPDKPDQWTDKGLNVVGKDISKYLPYATDAFKNVVNNNPSKDIPATTQREKAVKSFMQSTGKEFLSYIDQHKVEPTYAAIVDFLYDKSRKNFLSGKEHMSNAERNDFSEKLNVIDKGLTVLDQFNKDVSAISNELLNPEKKIVNPLLVTKNEKGNWRFKSKDEVEQDKINAQNDIITYDKKVWIKTGPHGGETISETPVHLAREATRTFQKYRDPELVKKLESLYDNYDNNIESFNKTIQMPASLKFTADQFKLKQYGVYELGSRSDVQGEDAEKAISQLLYIANTDYQGGTDNRTALEKAVDETPFAGIDRSAVKGAISNILNSISTSNKDHNVQYLQYTGLPGDERQAYVIRFNDEYLRSRISELEGELGKKAYQKTISGGEADQQIQALKVIQENGLKVFAGQDKGISGSLTGEYNIFERSLQEDMKYSSPEYDKDRMDYNIRKLSDGTYELTGKYIIKDFDDKGNVIQKEIPLASGKEQVVRFPFKSSFSSIIKTTNDWIAYQLDQAETLYNNKKNQLPQTHGVNTLSEDDLEKKIRLSKGQ